MVRITKFSELGHAVKLVAFLGCALCLLGSASSPLRAQANIIAARLSGIVTDTTGAVVPGANLTLTSLQEAFERKFTTSDLGEYLFPLLPPGRYRLTVEKAGFKTYEQPNIVLTAAQASTLDVKLEVGAVAQTVEVKGSGPILQTTDANIGADINTRAITEMPVGWRNVYGLVALNSSVNDSAEHQAGWAGGANGAFDDQDIAFTNFGGGRFGTTGYLLDGHWNASGYGGNMVMYAPEMEETEELKIQTNSFTSQYGWSMGNYVSAVTKSGTNAFHGDMREFLRNSDLDANYFFNNARGIPRPTFRLNQFGFTAGGPLYLPKLYKQRNKTFVFGSFFGRRQETPTTVLTTMPTSAMMGGNFSAFLGSQIGTDALGRPVLAGQIYNPFTTRSITAGQVDPTTGLVATQSGYIRDPFAGNIIPPSMLDSVALAAQKFYPAPNQTGLTNNFIATAGAPASETAYTVRVDHNISDKSRFYSRWSQKHQTSALGGAPQIFGAGNPAGTWGFSPDNRLDWAGDYAHTFSPTTMMTVDLGYGRWVQARTAPVTYLPSALGLPAFLDDAGFPKSDSIFPTFSMSGMQGLGPEYGFNGTPEDNKSVAVDFSKIRGKHSMSFGYMLVDFLWNNFYGTPASFSFTPGFTQGPNPTAANTSTGLSYASFLLGTGSGGITVNARAADHKNMTGGYFEDDWRITPKLTLNLGLRYEYQTAPTDRYNRFAWFNYSGANPISQQIGFTVPGYLQFTGGSNRRGIFVAQKTNFAPRVGLAYSISNKLVARAGFGMFYTPAAEMPDYEGLDEFGSTQTTPWVGTLDGITPLNLLSNPFPSGLITPPGKSLGALTNVGQSTDAMEPFRPTPYVEQWSLGFQYALTQNDSLEVAYIGNHGVKLLASGVAMDQLPTSDLSLGNDLLTQVPNPFYPYITTSGCGLNNPTIVKGQLLRPFPEYCGINDPQMPGEFSSYEALQVTYNHRWSQGLQMLASFTASKYLDDGSGDESWAVGVGAESFQNNYNLSAEKSLDGDDIPRSLVLSYVYELPAGKGKHFGSQWGRPVNAALGGWQVTGVTTFKSGFPLHFNNVVNNTGSDGGGQRPNLVGDPHVSNPTISEWFNTAAFAQPAAYTFGNVARTMPNLRAPGLNNWDLGIQKYFPIQEKVRLQFRAEMFDAFNHVNFYAPNQSYGVGPLFGQITSAYAARQVQFALKLIW
jgi:hypothetical protein